MEKEERNMFLFTWKIENFSFSWHRMEDYFRSPSFKIWTKEGSSWCLKLYPKGISPYANSISLCLYRELTNLLDVKEPIYLSVDYELSFLKSDGTPEYTNGQRARLIDKGKTSFFANLTDRHEIFNTKRSIFLPDDTLTVQCHIGFSNLGLPKPTQAFAKSTICVRRQLFLWNTGDFNYISPCKPGMFSQFSFQSSEVMLDQPEIFSLHLEEDSIIVHLDINYEIDRVFRLRMGILDSNKSTSDFLIDKYISPGHELNIETFLILRSELLQKKDLYLHEGRLILHLEWSYSSGLQIGQIDCQTYDNIFTSSKFDKYSNVNTSLTTHFLCSSNFSSMKNDFQSLHQEETLCDFEIKVGNEILRVHKAVLCARSTVLKAMLTSNMKEAVKNQMEIEDLEVDVVRRMLTYMYTDTADGLDWETAQKLYFAADKYDIATLRLICTEFLKLNIITADIEDIAALADTHLDEDLKKVASEFLQSVRKNEANPPLKN